MGVALRKARPDNFTSFQLARKIDYFCKKETQ